jgi:hypothetical protein
MGICVPASTLSSEMRTIWREDRPMAMIEIDEVVRGRMVGTEASTGDVYPRGRVCAAEGCTTVLSIYNPRGVCWQHEQPHPYVLQAPRKRRKDARVADRRFRDVRV